MSPALAGGFLTTVPPGKPTKNTIERIHEIRVEVTASVKRYEETARKDRNEGKLIFPFMWFYTVEYLKIIYVSHLI